ncbi:MAG: flagellar biosynthesis anti-sigma factor FlgM [Planctomycetaceae bacterium]|nr:flagellar biosynthesis anti-sigma factor FlgM [Planctomycetaceae bacterium]
MADFGSINGNTPSSLSSAYGAGGTQGARATSDASQRIETKSAARPTASRASDRVEVSETARWLEEMNRLPAIREDKVAAARAAIANGTLDSDEKLAIAVSRMIDEIS